MKDIEVLENITETYIDVDNAAVDIGNNSAEVYTEQLETNVDIDSDNVVEIEISEAFPFSSEGVLDNTFGNKDVLIDGGGLNDINHDTITMQEVLENCAALGGLENISHGALHGRELDGQHPISAITGLREELDNITALKTVYSNGKGVAQYYMWNEITEDNIGYFVTKLSNDTIKIIDNINEDIFGVVVESAGFICNQNTAPRDSSYGLVVYAGEVDARCEPDVEVGDYVVANDAGYAKKSTSGKGYKVTAVYKPHDISFATISLVLSANQINDLGEDVQDLSIRMRKAEADVTQAINTAQTAYNMALVGGSGNTGSVNASTVAKAEEALDKAESALTATENMNAQVQGAIQSAARANKIASDALASASSMKTEAIEKSDQALSEATNTRTELQAQVNQTKTDLDNTRSELINSINEVNGTISNFKTEVKDNYATQEMLTAYKTESSTALANYKQEVKDNYATQEMLTLLETDTTKALSDYKQEVKENYASQEMVNQYKNDASDALTKYQQEVKENYATQEMLTDLETNTTKALSDYKLEATKTYAKAETLTSFMSGTNSSLSTLTQQSDTNGAYIQGFVSNIDKYSYGKYSQANRFTYEEALNILELGVIYVPSEDHEETYEASENYAAVTYRFDKGRYYTWSISTNEQGETIRTWVGSNDTSVKFSDAYVTGNENAPYWVAGADVVIDEKVAYEKDCLYKWENELWIKVATLQGNLGAVTTSILKQTSDSIEMAVTNVKNDYAGTKTWVNDNKAAIQGVVEWHGEKANALATTIQQASDAEAYIGQVASVKNPDGTVNAIASIVAEVNKDSSTVSIDADKINFTGFTTFVRPGELATSGATTINGSNITTGIISSSGYTDNNDVVYSDVGTCFNLNDGSITAPNFAITNDGVLNAKNAIIEGDVTATKGNIGGFTIEPTKDGATFGGWLYSGDIREGQTSVQIGSDKSIFLSTTDMKGTIDADEVLVLKDMEGVLLEDSNGSILLTSPTAYAQNITRDDWRITVGRHFGVTSDGTLYASAANLGVGKFGEDASIFLSTTDISGTLGRDSREEDELLDVNGLFLKDKDGRSLIAGPGGQIVTRDDWRMTVGSHFGVTSDGTLYASAAKLGSGTLGSDNSLFLNTTDMAGVDGFFDGTSINNWRMTVGSHFGVTSDGSVYANKGKLGGWFITDTELKNYSGEPDADGYYPHSFCMQVKTNDNDATNALAIGKARQDNWSNAAFRVTVDGKLYAANAEITNGSIILPDDDDKCIELGTSGGLRVLDLNPEGLFGKYSCAQYSADVIRFGYSSTFNGEITNTNGLYYCWPVQSPYIEVSGTWTGTESGSIVSDATLKHEIEFLDERYDIFFDYVIPRRFQYNHGTGGRYHTGYITQEIQEALRIANINEKELAAICTFNKVTGEEYSALRYDEFIALNTWQIQKAKRRITTLEDYIQKLEERIEQLESKMR